MIFYPLPRELLELPLEDVASACDVDCARCGRSVLCALLLFLVCSLLEVTEAFLLVSELFRASCLEFLLTSLVVVLLVLVSLRLTVALSFL